MLLGLATAAIVLAVLVCVLAGPKLGAGFAHASGRMRQRILSLKRRRRTPELDYDPGRERRAELRALALLRSCVNEEEWAMYRDLGFLRVWGHSRARLEVAAAHSQGAASEQSGTQIELALGTALGPESEPGARPERHARGEPQTPRYAYLIYPHKPIVAYRPRTGTMLSEYCVTFPDHSRPYGSARLPDSDDVLAKWMALTADEHRLIADANMHLPGRQVDPERVKRDLARLARWERERSLAQGGARERADEPGAGGDHGDEAQREPRVGRGRLGAGSVPAA